MKKLTAVALFALVLAGCSSAEKQQQQAEEFVTDESSIAAAQHSAMVNCEGAQQCDTAWALTKQYIAKHSDMPVTRADKDGIDTDVPDDSGKVAFSATRVANSNGATLTLFAQCRGMYGPDKAKGSDYTECAKKIIKTQDGYVDYLRAHATGQ